MCGQRARREPEQVPAAPPSPAGRHLAQEASMRAAPHAGSRPSRCRHPRALAAAADGCNHRPCDPRRRVQRRPRPGRRAYRSRRPDPAFDDAGYWAVADRLQARLDGCGTSATAATAPAGGGCESMINALMLLTHSVAARAGTTGASATTPRPPDRPRARLAARLHRPQPPRRAGRHDLHAPGWSSSMSGGTGGRTRSSTPRSSTGSSHAWRARRELDLPPRRRG